MRLPCPNLQATHAAFPWIVTWDDHEVDNNYADEVPQDPELQSTEDFLRRRAAAYQAYYEHMPLRRFSIPRGSDMQLYRRLTFGDLAEVSLFCYFSKVKLKEKFSLLQHTL